MPTKPLDSTKKSPKPNNATKVKPNEETVRVRPTIAARERGPGPGRYGLPSTFGMFLNKCIDAFVMYD